FFTCLLNKYSLFEKPEFIWIDEDALIGELVSMSYAPGDPRHKKSILHSYLKTNLKSPEALDIIYVLCKNDDNRRKIDEYAPVASTEISVSVESVHLKDKELTKEEMEKEQDEGVYTFDARQIENPFDFGPEGIKKQKIVGTDPRVKEWLRDKPRVTMFLRFMKSQARTFIRQYCKKGIKKITFRVGCYAGKQRSVFSAEELWKFLNGYKNVKLIGDTPAHKSINEPWY
ncbi:MAG: hypothetical protein ACHQVK_01675, partial [Candidatus Paceibacterales bacterium]